MLKTVTKAVLTYEDGTTEEFISDNMHMHVITTYQTVEFWPQDKPEAKHPRTRNEPVRYGVLTIHMEPPANMQLPPP